VIPTTTRIRRRRRRRRNYQCRFQSRSSQKTPAHDENVLKTSL